MLKKNVTLGHKVETMNQKLLQNPQRVILKSDDESEASSKSTESNPKNK